MKKIVLTIVCMLMAIATHGSKKSLIRYIDPQIGTGSVNHDYQHGRDNYGQCMPAVLVPYGMNFWIPQTGKTEAHGVSPYYDNAEKIQGFRNSHYINGGSTQDYGSVTIMPMIDKLVCQPEERASDFSHEASVFRPDYFSTPLYGGDIKAEMTGTSRTGIFRFTFAKSGRAHLVITPNSDEKMGKVYIDAARGEVTGENPVHRIYQGRGERAGFSGHFLVQVQKKIIEYGVYEGEKISYGANALSDKADMGAFISFDVKAGEEVIVKVSSSFCNVEGARKNMQNENAGWNFDKIRKQLSAIWEKQLSAITVESTDEELMTQFYTSLYHASFCPHAFNDVDGQYPSFAGGTEMKRMDGVYYEDFSLWDTYRALHPLISILYPEMCGDMLQSLVMKYEQGGWLPIFPAWNCYTSEMIGDPCASLFADAYTKGIRNFNAEKAYEALMKNAYETPDNYADYADGKGRRAITSYMKYGYIPVEDPVREAYHQREQTSRTLEYAYDDYCVARLAEALGHTEEAKRLYERSKNYRNVFDPRLGYVNGRHEDGSFVDNMNPTKYYNFITQGSPCQYSWYVPHDVEGLMECMGGKDEYIARLDSMFSENRMWHGNEPGHQISFMYNYAGQPWKTQREVRNIMAKEYHLGADGLSGNDDSGQMAAWYIFAAVGFYPVCPGAGYYNLASPAFEKITIRMASGKKFVIKAKNASRENIYVQSCTLNGRNYKSPFLQHEDIAQGGKMEFVMGNTPCY